MKRIALLLLVMCLLLSACGQKNTEETTTAPTQTETTAATTQSTTEETTQETTQETTEAASEEFRHPLNGMLLDAPWTGRTTAVVINNHEEALPQHGINAADILYEFETEGGVTRRLGFFSDLSAVDVIGPIRSARTYFLNAAAAYDAPLAHCGGSDYAMKAQYDVAGNRIENWEHVDEMYNSGYFFRDKARQANGYAFEHTLFTAGENLLKALDAREYATVSEEGVDYALQFLEEPEWDGESAQNVTIRFRGGKKTVAAFNKDTGRYAISQYGEVGIDGNTGEELESRNVLVIFAKQYNNGVHSFYDMVGMGEGYLACDGKIVPIEWQRTSVEEPFAYTLQDGEPAVLGVGNSYIAIIDGSVEWE